MIYTGAIVTEVKENEDYQLGMSSVPFNWDIGFTVDRYYELPHKDQNQSYSCGGQAVAYYKQILEGKGEQSAKFIYAQTYAKPNGGSSYEALGRHAITKGSCDEALCLSYKPNGMTDEQFMTAINDIREEAYKDGLTNKSLKFAYVGKDIDSVAQAIRDNKGCILGVYGQNNGTWTSENPKPPVGTDNRWAHWVYSGKAGMYKGKKGINFKNSWGKGVGDMGYQWITEEYFPQGIFFVWVLTDVSNVIIPRYIFTKPISFGETSRDVTYLQKRLVEEGYNQPITGYYGPITAKNVLAYQRKYKVASEGELTYLAGRRVGKKTLAMLNS